ncbi:hypothetical protein BDZ97DRAFT_2025974 [Flammula alnicola]|nr:hypothetical protein BDZ97DRAFT_2025974 [Flammula alnicola]
MARLPDQDKEYFRTTYLAQFPRFVNGILGPTGKLDFWWPHMAIVHSDYRKKGIMRALINIVRDKASTSGETLACGTTDDADVPIYIALGFTHRGQKIMPSRGDWPFHIFTLNTSNANVE